MKKKTVLTMVFILFLFGVVEAGVFKRMESEIVAMPEKEVMELTTRIYLDSGRSRKKMSAVYSIFTRPEQISQCINLDSGEKLSYTFTEISKINNQMGIQALTIKLPKPTKKITIQMKYKHDSKSYTGYYLNPSTYDNLFLGQVSKKAITPAISTIIRFFIPGDRNRPNCLLLFQKTGLR